MTSSPKPPALRPPGASGPITARRRDWLVCPACGALQAWVPLASDSRFDCGQCGSPLPIGRQKWLDKATALAVTAAVLFVCANAFTFLSLSLVGSSQDITLLSGASALLTREQWILAALVLITTFFLPLFEVFALLYLLVPYRLNWRLPGQIAVLHWLRRLQPWIMQDVFLLGALVTTVKLGDSASVAVGPGMVMFFALVGVLQMAYWVMNKPNLWGWLYANNCFTRSDDEKLYPCEICHAVVGQSLVRRLGRCPRCKAPIHTRVPDSLQKTTALILAATILYIPANLYPIMHYADVTVSFSSTILSGVGDLVDNRLWLIAAVVFIASVVVPLLKLALLTFLVISVRMGMVYAARQRVFLYHVTRFIGRWSMVDVFVVTLLTAVVQFGLMGQVEPGAALLPFAAVVVLTMLAAETFDPRLIWDAQDSGATDAPITEQERPLAER